MCHLMLQAWQEVAASEDVTSWLGAAVPDGALRQRQVLTRGHSWTDPDLAALQVRCPWKGWRGRGRVGNRVGGGRGTARLGCAGKGTCARAQVVTRAQGCANARSTPAWAAQVVRCLRYTTATRSCSPLPAPTWHLHCAYFPLHCAYFPTPHTVLAAPRQAVDGSTTAPQDCTLLVATGNNTEVVAGSGATCGQARTFVCQAAASTGGSLLAH